VFYAAGLALRWDTVQKKLAETRQSKEARYQLLAENMTDLVTRHAPNGAVVFASPASERLLGADVGELQGRGLFERVHVADRPAYLTALSDASRGGACSAEFRVRKIEQNMTGTLYTAPASFVWVEMRCRPLESAAGEVQSGHVIAITREISDRRAHEGSLEQARVEADRANAAKGKFLASMSHELRTPLNAIIGFSELLANEELARLDDKRRQEYAGLIHDSGLHLLAVVNGILDMSRIESGNFSIVAEPFSIPPVIDSCMQLFALKAESASVRLTADFRRDLPELMADKRACKQILINLLSNAIKFTPDGGEVRVSVHEEDAALRIEVADTGVGISSEDLPYLGNSFFQARSSYDRPYEGTGLGLSVVKGLVGLHGGSFDVESELGKGTCVTIRLPRDRGDAVAARPSETRSPPAHRERRAAIG
jgi:cell cycle sensor histidine kinase DivJ